MLKSAKNNPVTIGVLLAVLATIIWSGNFIVARGVIDYIPPVSLAFYRWFTASLIILPIAFRKFYAERKEFLKKPGPILGAAFFGVTLFNTFVYIAGKYSPAINLALIGTTSSPVMSIILAAFFLKETVRLQRVIGLLICITGILVLLSQGSWERLAGFHFSPGDWWILLAALCFAIYNIFARVKPASISPLSFLMVTFVTGTILLFPAYIRELMHSEPVQWNASLLGVVIYLGLGTSVLSFFFWNAAISRLGAGRTALFGNLIPVFSSLEAVFILHEKITLIHLFSGILVICGLIIANMRAIHYPGKKLLKPNN